MFCERGRKEFVAVRLFFDDQDFDGPGQGGMLRQREEPFRADWEAVVTPVLDFALKRPEVDPERIALMGRSFGGYLAPRAASAEHRLAALVADPGQFDLFEAAMSRVPQEMRKALLRNDPAVDAFLEKMMEGMPCASSSPPG